MQAAESLKKTLEAEAEQARPAEVVEYEGIFGPHTTLRYTPTFGGFKEDIILSRNIGVNEFSFIIETNGLSLVKEESSYYLADPLTGERVGVLGDILVYDSGPQETEPAAAEESESAPVVWQHRYQVETIGQDQTYRLTLLVDEAFLNDPATVYPVTVDPSFTFTGDNGGIEDATIYSGYKVNEGSSGALYVGNYTARNGGSRGVARTLAKFPRMMNNGVMSTITASQVISAKYYVRDILCESDEVRIDCYRMTRSWQEGTVKCDTQIWGAYANLLSSVYVKYGNGEDGIGGPQGGHWYGFDITQALKNWMNGSWAYYGVMLKAYNETQKSKTFASANRSTYTPSVIVNYTDHISVSQVCLTPTTKEMSVNDTAYLTATVVPSNATNKGIIWSSSNTSVVTVGSTGLICARAPGTATITARSSDNSAKYATCIVKVAYQVSFNDAIVSIYSDEDENLDPFDDPISELIVYADDELLTTAKKESNGTITACLSELVLSLATDDLLDLNNNSWEITTTHKNPFHVLTKNIT